MNTTLEDSSTIVNAGWGSMGGVNPEEVEGFKGYRTKYKDGSPVKTSQRKGHVLSDDDIKKLDIKKYMNDWTPSFMKIK